MDSLRCWEGWGVGVDGCYEHPCTLYLRRAHIETVQVQRVAREGTDSDTEDRTESIKAIRSEQGGRLRYR